jgi:hypothetical protein
MHPADTIHEPATHTVRGFAETDLALAGPGAPTVAEFARDRAVHRGRQALPRPGLELA